MYSIFQSSAEPNIILGLKLVANAAIQRYLEDTEKNYSSTLTYEEIFKIWKSETTGEDFTKFEEYRFNALKELINATIIRFFEDQVK